MPARIIFLDIDGVILPLGSKQFDQMAIERINALAREADAEIVIASSWRRHIGPMETIDALVTAGLAKPLCCLPELGEFSSKAEDVLAWLASQTEVARWVLIDDDPSVCRRVKALKDGRGLVVWLGVGGFGLGAFNRARKHLIIEGSPH